MPRTATTVIERNRANARQSTGPRTDEGKALARGNSLRHGLTANPAAGVIEDPLGFELLLRRLAEALCPRGIVEEAVIHRIAVAIFRLQRAAAIAGAVSGALRNGLGVGLDFCPLHGEQ